MDCCIPAGHRSDCCWGCRCLPPPLSQGEASVPPTKTNDKISNNNSSRNSSSIGDIISNSSNVIARSPPLLQGAASVPPNKINHKISNSNTSTSSSGNIIASNGSNVVVARAATPPPASARKDRLSFGPVPKEGFSIGSELLSFSSDDLWPSPPRRRSSSLGSAPRQNRYTAGADEIVISSNNGSDSSSCVIIDVVGGGADTETNDNHRANDVEHDLFNSSVASVEIESAGLLNGASLSLPPLGEVFSPDRKQLHQQQQQQHDLSPVPFIRGSSSGNPEPADFDFDVDEVDAMIGELLEDHDQGYELCLAGEKGGQHENLQQQLQEEGGGQQQHQQDRQHGEQKQQQQDREQVNQQVEQGQQDRQQQGDEKEDTVEEVKRQHETSSIAAAAAAIATAKFAESLKADLKDGPIAEAFEGVMALTQRTEASTKDAFACACAVAVQNQVYMCNISRIVLY